MAIDVQSRADLLKTIKAAEIERVRREENAKARIAQVKATTQTECARIVEDAGKEGRVAMRKCIEEAKAECSRVKELQVSEAVKVGQVKEAESRAKIPAVANLMFNKFKKEYDVKN